MHASGYTSKMSLWLCPVSPWVLAIAAVALASGAAQALLLKWQNHYEYESCTYDEHLIALQRCEQAHYSQAFLQTWFMFFGECFALSLSVYRALVRKVYRPPPTDDQIAVEDEEDRAPMTPSHVTFTINPFVVEGEEDARLGQCGGTGGDDGTMAKPRDLQEPGSGVHPPRGRRALKHRCPIWWWTTPAPLDFFECVLGNLAITMTYASSVQILHNFMVVSSAIFSMLVLRRALLLHEWLGCIVITIALVITSVPTLTKPDLETDYDPRWNWLGICFAVLSTSFHALQNIWEERLFMKGKVSAVLAVGVEGVTGVAITTLSLPLVQGLGIENVYEGIVELSRSRFLQVTMLSYAASSLINNAAGVLLTKWTSGLLRCVFMALRPPIVWVVELGISWNTFDWYTPVSMVFLSLGLWTYLLAFPFTQFTRLCRLLRTPIFCGFNLEPPETDQLDESSDTEGIELPEKRRHATPTTAGTVYSPVPAGARGSANLSGATAFLTEEDDPSFVIGDIIEPSANDFHPYV